MKKEKCRALRRPADWRSSSRPLRRFADHRRRLLHRPGRGIGRRDRRRGRKHQGRRRSYHRRKHAARHVAAGSRHGRAEAHRAQLQRRHEQVRFMDMTYYILRKDGAYAGVYVCGKGIPPAIRTSSRCTMERCAPKFRLRCSKDIPGVAADAGCAGGLKERFGVSEVGGVKQPGRRQPVRPLQLASDPKWQVVAVVRVLSQGRVIRG